MLEIEYRQRNFDKLFESYLLGHYHSFEVGIDIIVFYNDTEKRCINTILLDIPDIFSNVE